MAREGLNREHPINPELDDTDRKILAGLIENRKITVQGVIKVLEEQFSTQLSESAIQK